MLVPMAHAYTTKRGKNKISKLGVRKDHQQNSERQLKSNVPLANLQYNGPKESIFSIGHLANSRIEERKATARAIAAKCSNPNCESASRDAELFECASCHTVRYCGKSCQTSHWEEHKPACKEARKQMKAKLEAANEAGTTDPESVPFKGLDSNYEKVEEIAQGLSAVNIDGNKNEETIDSNAKCDDLD